MHLSTVIVTDAESTLAVETVGPEATKVHIGLAELGVSDDQPSTEDGLSKNIKDSVGNDLAIDTDLAGTVSEAPNTVCH
jgi:hypothetical protein